MVRWKTYRTAVRAAASSGKRPVVGATVSSAAPNIGQMGLTVEEVTDVVRLLCIWDVEGPAFCTLGEVLVGDFGGSMIFHSIETTG